MSLWTRQKGEGSRPFQAFALYRDMGYARSLAKVAKELGKSTTIVEQWSANNNWIERVAAWDAEEDIKRRDALAKKRIKMLERHATVAGSMINLSARSIINLAQKESQEPGTISARDAAHLAESGVKIERLCYGESTENINQKVRHEIAFARKDEENLKAIDSILIRCHQIAKSNGGVPGNGR